MAAARRSLTRIFWLPVALAGVIGFGLLSALLGDGLWDALSWIALALPLAVIIYYVKMAKQPL